MFTTRENFYTENNLVIWKTCPINIDSRVTGFKEKRKREGRVERGNEGDRISVNRK